MTKDRVPGTYKNEKQEEESVSEYQMMPPSEEVFINLAQVEVSKMPTPVGAQYLVRFITPHRVYSIPMSEDAANRLGNTLLGRSADILIAGANEIPNLRG